VKTGRNDPCPCGSGKKYKHCCLRTNEARERAARAAPEAQSAADRPAAGYGGPAMDVTRSIREEIARREFVSEEELRAFVDGRMHAANNEGQRDFEGLSPTQIGEILEARRSGRVPLMRIRSELAAEVAGAAPIVAALKWLLEYHADHNGEVQLTTRNHYRRPICREYVKRFTSWAWTGSNVPREESLEDLSQIHDILVRCGWTEEDRHRSNLTTEGIQLLKEGGVQRIFEEALLYMLYQEEWTRWLGEDFEEISDHFEIIQNAAVFTMYLLSQYPSGSVSELFGRFYRAFPSFLEPAKENRSLHEWLESVFAYLFIDRFAVPMGFVELSDGSEGDDSGDGSDGSDRYRVTPLFETAFRWG